MLKPEFHFFKNGLNPEKAAIELHSKGLIVAYLNTHNLLVGIEHFSCLQDNLLNTLQNKINELGEVHNLDFQNIVIADTSREWTLVPDELFTAQKPETYLNLLYEDIGNRSVFTHHYEAEKFHIVYAPANSEHTKLHCKTIPAISGFISMALNHNRKLKTVYPIQYCHFRENLLEIIVVESGKLLFCNQFQLKVAEDSLYHILNIIGINGPNTEKNPIFLSGYILSDSKVYQLIERFIEKSAFIQPENFDTGNRPPWYYSLFPFYYSRLSL